MEMGKGDTDCVSCSPDYAVPAYTDTSVGGFYSWKTDGYILYFHFFCDCLLCIEGCGCTGMGKPLYAVGLYRVWGGIARQSVFLKPF